MIIWGRLGGAIFGYLVGGGWFGAVVGFIFGYYFDQGIKRALENDVLGFNYRPGNQAQIQTTFFTSVFMVMGHIAKADGRVSESEIAMARTIMAQMQLNAEQQKTAINLFTKGKAADFPLEDVIDKFHTECHHNLILERMFIEILLYAAYADGHLHDAERHIFHRICSRLGISDFEFRRLEKMVHAQQAFHGNGQQQQQKSKSSRLAEAYAALGIEKSASDAEVKKAYRRQMNQHHPDKLVAKGMPEEMIKLANEKAHEIKAAYETICDARGIK